MKKSTFIKMVFAILASLTFGCALTSCSDEFWEGFAYGYNSVTSEVENDADVVTLDENTEPENNANETGTSN